ncbi:MAG: gliding motility lipoprotein GldH [Dokdonia sp.]|jgi:gliding motility-associated lipoprotein GldH|nr:gliding motility lipoprotein GldH [Cytophagaceae bacterium]
MRKWIGVFVVVLSLIGCDDNSVYDSYQSLGDGWEKSRTLAFDLADIDSLQPLDLFITLRANHEYPYNNLFLITEMNYPNGKLQTDTLEYRMAAPSGELLGAGMGDIKESKLWYKEGFRFRESGTYTLKINHAMRRNGSVEGDQVLKGITEVGMRIERPE